MNILIIIMMVLAAIAINFALYQAIQVVPVFIPKWLHIILLIPPFGVISIVLISIGGLMYAIYDTIKNL